MAEYLIKRNNAISENLIINDRLNKYDSIRKLINGISMFVISKNYENYYDCWKV
jgi:hypothetical protein